MRQRRGVSREQKIAIVLIVIVCVVSAWPVNSGQPISSATLQLSRLKQIAVGVALYSTDWSDYHPPDVLRTIAGSSTSAERFKAELAPYTKDDSLWIFTMRGKPVSNVPRIGMDGHVSSFCTNGDFWLDHKRKDSYQVEAKLTAVQDPASTNMLHENIYVRQRDRALDLDRGSDRIVVGYVDTHVKAIDLKEFLSKAKSL